jgi:hypothetical protein
MQPMSKRDFEKLLQQYGCVLEKGGKEWKVKSVEGKTVCTIAVTHGKQEVKPIYVKIFLSAIGSQQ